jgi:hypothetical protein
MHKRRKATGRSSKPSRFVQVPHWVLNAPMWKRLSPVERCAWIEVTAIYNGSNNGRLAVPVRRLADRLNVSQATASRALRTLVTLGFLELVKSSSFSKKSRKASEYRLTHLACDLTGKLPSKLFMHIGKASPGATHSSISGADSFMGETVD